jgi:hypothetical protein
LPSKKLIASLSFEFVPMKVYEEAQNFSKATPYFIMFDGRPIFVRRDYATYNMGEYPANFIRRSADTESNCQLVWGPVFPFDSCVFVQSTVDIKAGDELKLSYGGISCSDEQELFHQPYLPIIPLEEEEENELEKNLSKTDLLVKRVGAKLNKQLSTNIANTGLCLSLVFVSYGGPNWQALKDLYEERNFTVQRVAEKLKQMAIFHAAYVYNGESHWSNTSGNGLCFFSSVYQTMLRNTNACSHYNDFDSFPISEEYIKTFCLPSNLSGLKVSFSTTNNIVLEDVLLNIEANTSKLTKGDREGYKWGFLDRIAYLLNYIPTKRLPMYYYNLMRKSTIRKSIPSTETYLIDKRLWVAYAGTINSFSYSEMKVELAEFNPIFYDTKHFWVSKDKLAIDVDEALNTLAEDVCKVMIDVEQAYNDTETGNVKG